MKSTSGRFSASSAPAVPRPAPSASNAWTYWLIRSAAWPPVMVLSPRYMTGLSRCRLRAATIRCPLCDPVRMSSVMRPRLERVLGLRQPREHRVQPRIDGPDGTGFTQVPGEQLVEPARCGDLGDQLSEVDLTAQRLARAHERRGDVAAGVVLGKPLRHQPVGDRAEELEVRGHGRRRGGQRLVRRRVVDADGATEDVEQ